MLMVLIVFKMSNRPSCYSGYILFLSFFISIQGERLLVQTVQIQSSTCNISLNWEAPVTDRHMVVGYYVVWEENRFGQWETPVEVSVGNRTQYQSECNLLPGRLYRFRVSAEIRLTNPNHTVFVDSFFPDSQTILGKIYKILFKDIR